MVSRLPPHLVALWLLAIPPTYFANWGDSRGTKTALQKIMSISDF